MLYDKRMLHFEGHMARCNGYYILRDVSRTAIVSIIEGRIARRDGYLDNFVLDGS